jgi:16S rRNA C967 or C1407 C5-methylase (RsmB/RsmF family)/NOL1/NOP2/fmu family ribosome biogenesis protein
MASLFPEAFAQRMMKTLGDQFEDFQKAHAENMVTSVRKNIQKAKGSLQHAIPVPWTTTGYYLAERPRFTLDPHWHAGVYYVQEASSMFLEQALKHSIDLSKTLKVLDLCAAPGGKSTHLSSLLTADSVLVSNEVIRSRSGILAENLQKWGNDHVIVTQNDPADFQALPGYFDVIVVDAPCSGEGLFRKDPDAMKAWSEEHVALCAGRQRRILNDIWPALKENGILVYCTCTYNAFENEDNLNGFHNDNHVQFLDVPVNKEWGIEIIEDKNVRGYRFYPHHVMGEGFFLSVMQKKEKPQERNHTKGIGFIEPSKKVTEELRPWLKNAETKTFIQRQDLIQFFPASMKNDIALLAKNLRLITAGTFMASLKHDKLIPEHAMALSNSLAQKNFPHIELTLEQAIQFLKKETINVQCDFKGFALAVYQEQPLGWVNVLANRINNLYPSEWRIRMTDKN